MMGRHKARFARVAALGFASTLSGCGASQGAGGARTAPPLAAPRAAMGELDGRALMGELPDRAVRLGAGVASLVASTEALDNGWVGGFVDVPRDDCMLGYARGSSSIDDVDVAVYSEDGTTLAVDEGRDVHPTVLMCPPHPDRVYIAAHVVEGEGLVAVGAQLVPKDRAVIVARALGARGVVSQGPRPADGWPGLDDTVRAHRLELGGLWEEFRRVALAADARVPTVLSLPVEAGQCVDVVVVPDDDVALLDLEAFDDRGRIIGRAKDGPGARTLTICSPIQVSGTLTLRPHVGRGLAAVVLARARDAVEHDLSALADVAWVAPSQTLDQAKLAREALLVKTGYAASVASATGSLVLGRRISIPLDLAALGGACGRVDVVAGAPLALVDARIWSDAGALLSSGDAAASLALFACARGPVRLELETRGRPGPFAVTVRPERWGGPAFTSHPLAASRMLARATTGPDMLFDGKELATRELMLDGDHVVSWKESIPADACLRATVGAQGDGAGVELRAFDESDTEIDRSEAAHAASVRACAPSGLARSVRFEVRSSAGRMTAILGERTSPKM